MQQKIKVFAEKGVPAPAKKNASAPTHKPAPTQGEGCVKGGPSAGPPFAFNQGTDQDFAGGMRSPRHQKRTPPWGRSFLVPLTGIEPVRCFHRGILSPLRLPVPPQRRRAGINLTHLTIALRKSQAQGLTNPHRALYNTLVNSKKGIDRVSAAPPPPERKPPAERLSAVPVHHSRPRAIGVRNAGVPGALNRQKRQRPTALQSGWYHGRFGFRPYGFAKEAGEESCFYFSPIARKMQKKKGIYPL